MKYTKKKGNQNKPQGRRQKFNTSTNKSLAVSDDSRQTRSDQITLRPETHAARAVFNTVGSAIMSIRKLSLTDHTA
jgi:hypothetical protein